MRISASLGVLVATGLLGRSASQATDYGNTNGSPIGNQPDGSGNGIPGNNGGVPNTLPYPSNTAGSIPGSVPSGVGPVGPVFPGDDSNGLPPSGPVGNPASPGGGSNGPYPSGLPPMDLLAVLPLPVAAPAAPIPTAPAAFPVTFPALALQTMAPMVFLLLDPLAVPFLLVAAPTVAAPTVPIPAASPPTDLLAVLEIFLNLFPGALQATALAMLQVASQVLDL
ncbi:hypothetical protein NXS19_013213 [Fusarium pseudograminearum]|nr:hypothetical protein NXS19_013213 [Fusarium pseudograminearum]